MATTSAIEDGEVFEQLQAVVAGAEVPVENGEVDGLSIGLEQGGFGVGGREDAAVEVGAFQPLAEGAANRLFVVHDQNGFGRKIVRRHDNSQPRTRGEQLAMAPPHS